MEFFMREGRGEGLVAELVELWLLNRTTRFCIKLYYSFGMVCYDDEILRPLFVICKGEATVKRIVGVQKRALLKR